MAGGGDTHRRRAATIALGFGLASSLAACGGGTHTVTQAGPPTTPAAGTAATTGTTAATGTTASA